MDSDGGVQIDDDVEDNNSLYEADSGNESSGSDEEVNFDNRLEPSSSRNDDVDVDEYVFQVLSVEDIVQYMNEEINEVNDVIQLPATTVRILLNHFRWDKARLLERFYDTDQEGLFREAHIVSPFVAPQSSIQRIISRPGAVPTEDCEICIMVQPSAEMTGLQCGHRFCASCWCEYLTTKIMDEGMGQTIACAAHGCDILVDDETVMRLVSEPRVLQRYQHLICNSLVECNRNLCWCPSPDCGYAVRVSYPDCRAVTCKCGHRFCFACGETWHDPVRCTLFKKWLRKCEDDSETFNWLSANTKECPKCNATIEKSGGCNHMVCKNLSCRADFCWVCLGPWQPHGSSWYNCNRYDEAEAKAARDAQEQSRASLTRYLFYFNRYMNHMQSLKFENKLYAAVKEKMEEMQQHNMSWIEVQFLKKAVDILCACRQTLMYTYVFAYYLRKNNQSVIFEDNQKDLENCTEVLSEYLERDITQENIVDIKQKVQDKYRYCESRRKVLLAHVHEGYERDWWLYTE